MGWGVFDSFDNTLISLKLIANGPIIFSPHPNPPHKGEGTD